MAVRRSRVAAHLGISLAEYDSRIRTFIPDYEAMLDAGARAVPTTSRTIVDLGIGTGAFSERCLARARHARVIGIDADPDIVKAAARRLKGRAACVTGSFMSVPLPRCDVVIASFALHHVRTLRAKAALFRRIRTALRRHGRLVIVDCQPARERSIRSVQFEDWRAHLRRHYSARAAGALLRSWSREDTYVPLDVERSLLGDAGFRTEVIRRRGAFAVIVAAPDSASNPVVASELDHVKRPLRPMTGEQRPRHIEHGRSVDVLPSGCPRCACP